MSVNTAMGFRRVAWCDSLSVRLERIRAQIAVDAREVTAHVLRNWHRSTESAGTPNDLCGALNKGGDAQHLVGAGPHGHQAVVGDQGGGAASSARTALRPTSGVPDAAYSVQRTSPPQ